MRLRLCAAAAALAAASNPLQLTIAPDGSYSVTVSGFVTLKSGRTGLMVGGVWPSLSPSIGSPAAGQDSWGAFSETQVTWSGAGVGDVFASKFKIYSDVPAINFEQVVLQSVSPGGTDRENVSTSFPSWTVPATSPETDVGYMQFWGPFLDGGSSGPRYGLFNVNGVNNIVQGLKGGPLVLFDSAAAHTLVFSASSAFMATNFAQVDGDLSAGLLGSVVELPAGTTSSCVLWYGTAGINPTVMAWGAALLAAYGKASDGSQSDFTNTHLQYNTDHGAYYYYTTGNYSTYSDMLLAVNEYATAAGIPYKAVLLDSWWYFKGNGGGVSNWTARPDVFPPGGAAGINAIVQATGWKVTAHNRFWANDTVYAKQNGGQWDFFIDAHGKGQMAVPLTSAFWEWLLPNSVKEWGLTTYEQDWLYNELEGVSLLTQDVTAARTWLLQMQAGAQAAGTTIQMCMPYPRHILQSLEMPSVTQVRASDDHVQSEGYYHSQWRLGYSSLLAWAVAVAPFKDNFLSTHMQPGGSIGTAPETSPALQEAISVLSAGPVTPADGVGFSDAALILRSCTTGGRLLQPSRAATGIDGTILFRTFPGVPGLPDGEIYATYSLVSGWAWDHVLAAQVNASYAVTPADLASIRADAHVKDDATPPRARLALVKAPALAGPKAADAGVVAYALNSTTFDMSTLVVRPFSESSPIPISECGEVDFQLWHTAPVFTTGVALLGELTKFVPMAPARVHNVAVDGASSDVSVDLVGEAGEVVPFTVWSQAGGVATIVCTLGPAGTATLSTATASCRH